MRVLISIVVTAAVALGMYFFFLRSALSGSGGSPAQMISTTSVQMQLVSIAQAERMYYVQNSTYATLDDLASSGTLTLKTPDPDGYTYAVDASPSGFKATARHADAVGGNPASYPVISIDQTMQVQRGN
jgi:hypothetical protein